MKRSFHHTSHLAPMNCDRFMVAPELSIRRLLEIEIEAAATLLHTGVPELIERGANRIAECREQLVILDCIEYGYIRPVLGQG